MQLQVLATRADFPTASDSRKYEVFLDLEMFCISSVGVPTWLRCELDKGINVKVEARGCPSPGAPRTEGGNSEGCSETQTWPPVPAQCGGVT